MSSKLWLCLVLGLCFMALGSSAPNNYEEPEMEADTGDAEEEGFGDNEDVEEGSADNEGMEEDGDMAEKEDTEEDEDEKVSAAFTEADTSDEEGKDDTEAEKESSDVDDEETKDPAKTDDDDKEKEDDKDIDDDEDKEDDKDEKNGEDKTDKDDSMDKEGCPMGEAMKTMNDLLKELTKEIAELRGKLENNCSDGEKSDDKEDSDKSEESGEEGSDLEEDSDMSTESPDIDEDGASKEQVRCNDDEDEDVDESGAGKNETIPETTTLPPPPENCPQPFQLIAESCYYIQSDSREWRSWGEALSFCQQQSGSLAAPYRAQQLRDYLQQYYSSVFWVGARQDEEEWQWLNGETMTEEDWKTGKPGKHPSKKCVYLDAWHHYKGVNSFCGEKFSFICEYRQV